MGSITKRSLIVTSGTLLNLVKKCYSNLSLFHFRPIKCNIVDDGDKSKKRCVNNL